MNISQETISRLESFVSVNFFDKYADVTTPDKATSLSLGWYVNENDGYCGLDIKSTKKEITFDYVINKLEKSKNKPITDLRMFESLSKLCSGTDYTGYGLSLCAITAYKDKESKIDGILDNLGIKYKKVFSEARLVLRYEISKSKENLELISRL